MIGRSLREIGLDSWISSCDIPAGTNWVRAVTEAIGLSKVVLVLLSERAATSDHVLREIHLTSKLGGKMLVPLYVGLFQLPKEFEYFLDLHQRIALPARPSPQDIDVAIKRIRSALRTPEQLKSDESAGLLETGPRVQFMNPDDFFRAEKENAILRLIGRLLGER
jgi:hypothetical protein